MDNIFLSSICIRADKIGEIVKILAENNIKNIELSSGTKYYKSENI